MACPLEQASGSSRSRPVPPSHRRCQQVWPHGNPSFDSQPQGALQGAITNHVAKHARCRRIPPVAIDRPKPQTGPFSAMARDSHALSRSLPWPSFRSNWDALRALHHMPMRKSVKHFRAGNIPSIQPGTNALMRCSAMQA